jgi:hypothetical protein
MTSSSAPTQSKGGRPKGSAALFTKTEIAEIIKEAKGLEAQTELIDWAKENSLVWLVVLNRLIFKAKGPNAVAQVGGTIDKLIKTTGKILETPRDHDRPVSDTPSGEDDFEEGDSGPGDDAESIGALLEEASKFLAGE